MNGLPVPTNQPETTVTGITTTTAAASTPQRLFDLGPVKLHPHPYYRFSYGNGIQPVPGEQSKTVINELSPGLLIDIGNHWHLDYTPTLRFYSNKRFRDSTDHAVNLNWDTLWQDWMLGFSQSYASSSSPLIETGSQTDTETYSTAFNVVYQLNSKVSVDSAINQNFRYVASVTTNQPLSDSRTWSTTEGLNYQVWPGFSVGLSLGFTYDALSVGPDMTSEQLQGRLNWRPGNKLTLSLNGGFEDRQFVNSMAPDAVNPIFGVSAIYQLFEVTTLTLSANRTVTASYFQNQITETMGFTFGLQQRLLQKLSLSLSGGYGTSSFQSTIFGFTVNREDNHANFNARLTCPILEKGSASIFYDWSDNSSNQGGFAYSSNQVGFELGYRF